MQLRKCLENWSKKIEKPSNNSYRLTNWVVLLASSCLLVGLYIIVSANTPSLECTWVKHYGVMCPTCFITRALKLLFRGEVTSSLHLHPGAFALTLFLLVQILFRIYQLSRRIQNPTIDVILNVPSLFLLWAIMNRYITIS
jgi:hypothetical protein